MLSATRPKEAPVTMTRPDTREPIRLGLIGDNIAASRAPRLHVLAGEALGLRVTYDRLVPREMGLPFEEVLAWAEARGFRGVNVTYPYKERVVPLVRVGDARVARLGAINTVRFGRGRPEGHNTDWSGFAAAYRQVRGDAPAGAVCMIGAGGVGRAIGFALAGLGATSLRIADRDAAKARALAAELRAAVPGLDAAEADAAEASIRADGLVNCTPLGMDGHPGTPLPRAAMAGASWAFDAVYTPPETRFLSDAAAEGLQVIGGEALFLHQGLDAVAIFHGRGVDEAAMRRGLGRGLAQLS